MASTDSTTASTTDDSFSFRPVITALFVIVLSTLFLLLLRWRTSSTRISVKQTTPVACPQCPSHVSPALWSSFQQAVESVATANTTTNQTRLEQLTFYALYQQAVHGDAPPTRPCPFWHIPQRLRYTAWTKVRGMSTAQAIGLYTTMAATQGSGGSGSMMGAKAVSRPVLDTTTVPTHDSRTVAGQLLDAASSNDVERLSRLLLSHNTSSAAILLNQPDESTGQTALLLAANTGSIPMVRLLLDAGARLDVADANDGITVLQTAVVAGHVELCRFLLLECYCRANPDAPDHDGDTPRSAAMEEGDKDMMAVFAEYDAARR